MCNAETVQAIYEAFGRGDVAPILDKLGRLCRVGDNRAGA